MELKNRMMTLATILLLVGSTAPLIEAKADDPILDRLVKTDKCTDSEWGKRSESYACTLTCTADEMVGGIITTDQQVDRIVVGADCGTVYDADICDGSSHCATTETQTESTAKGSCEGWTKELNYWETYHGDLYCYSSEGPGSSTSTFRSSGPEGASCHDVEEALRASGWVGSSFVQISFHQDGSIGTPNMDVRGVRVFNGVCQEFEPYSVFIDGGWFMSDHPPGDA